MSLRIGILGTRGVPNEYGGFEQFAAYLSKGLVEKGHAVTVYDPHNHSYKQNEWNGVHIVHCFDPEFLLGTAGQFIYDLNCIIDARRRKFDILLILGYTSSSIWGRWFPKESIVVTNMDGMEWKRAKYSNWSQRYLFYAEKLAVKFSDFCIADSLAIQQYLDKKYKIQTKYISYGAEIIQEENRGTLSAYGVTEYDYFMVMARMEPENNVETILAGICSVKDHQKILVIGNTDNAYGRNLVKKFGNDVNVLFTGSIHDAVTLHTLKTYSLLYFHGHSVGGTNPSLLEAMASGALICAHDNLFNRAVLGEAAFYFSSAKDVSETVMHISRNADTAKMIKKNLEKIKQEHSWDTIITAYEQFFIQCYQSMQ